MDGQTDGQQIFSCRSEELLTTVPESYPIASHVLQHFAVAEYSKELVLDYSRCFSPTSVMFAFSYRTSQVSNFLKC